MVLKRSVVVAVRGFFRFFLRLFRFLCFRLLDFFYNRFVDLFFNVFRVFVGAIGSYRLNLLLDDIGGFALFDLLFNGNRCSFDLGSNFLFFDPRNKEFFLAETEGDRDEAHREGDQKIIADQ